MDTRELVRDLGGVEPSGGGGTGGTPGLSDALHQEEKRLDTWRVLLGETVVHFAKALRARSFGPGREQEDLDRMLASAAQLVKMPGADGRMLVRYRGRRVSGGEDSRLQDYVALTAGLDLDLRVAQGVMARKGPRAVEIEKDLQTAFGIFAEHQIQTIYIHFSGPLTDRSGETRKHLATALDVLTAAAPAAEGQSPPPQPGVILIRGDKGQPELNFSILATINGLKPDVTKSLIHKIISAMRKAGVGDPLEQFICPYEAVFAFRNLREKLQRPRVEINNLRWLVTARLDEPVSRQRVKLFRAVSQAFHDSPRDAARFMDSLFAPDYGRVTAVQLVSRLGLFTDFLRRLSAPLAETDEELVDMSMSAESTIMEVLGNVENNLDRVRDQVFDSLALTGEEISASQEDGSVERALLDGRLYDLVAFFQHRSATKQKMKSMLRQATDFDLKDYQTIARDFSITVKNAQELVALFKTCFDETGKFLRKDFERNIPAFSRHEKKVFEFLWYYLKEIMDRHDRIAFLNALQLLIDQMKLPRKALTVLLDDFRGDPETVTFSDRNALMLSNLLLRKYNKELHNDIEITPEEVLKVKEGLNPEAVEFLARLIEEEKDSFFGKIRTIHREVKRSLGPETEGVMPLRYILTLEREVYILLALAGGATARAVIRSAIKEYGNPDAEIYHLEKSGDNVATLFQILQVAIRGLGRVGEISDLVMLDEIRGAEAAFLFIRKDSRTRDLLRRAMRYVEGSKTDITQKRWTR
jgi:hypothetical protein